MVFHDFLITQLPWGDRSFAISVERSVRFALVLAGMDAAAASWWSGVGLRSSEKKEGGAGYDRYYV